MHSAAVGVAVGPIASAILVEAEIKTPRCVAQLVQIDCPGPIDLVMEPADVGVLDMSLTPRSLRSQAAFIVDGNEGTFRPLGTVFFRPPKSRVRVQTWDLAQRFFRCEVRMPGQSEWETIDKRRLYAGLDLCLPTVRAFCLRMVQELSHPGFASEVVVDALAHVAAVDLARFYGAKSEDEPARRGGISPWRLRRVCERIESDGRTSVSELAELCGVSARHLMRSFRESQGETLGQYIARVRIERAKRLLAGDQPIAAISAALGFASPSSFSSAFRAAVGAGPREYRAVTRTRPGAETDSSVGRDIKEEELVAS
jgi:AraC family transcriptional regulator